MMFVDRNATVLQPQSLKLCYELQDPAMNLVWDRSAKYIIFH